MDLSPEYYPIVIVEDRYRGSYSGGQWLAIREADVAMERDGPTRAPFVVDDGPSGSDPEARTFWDNPPDWIAVGATPDEAVLGLIVKAAGERGR